MKTCIKQRLLIVSSLLSLFYLTKDIILYKKTFYGHYYDRVLYDLLNNISTFILQNIYLRDLTNLIGSLSLDASFIIVFIIGSYYKPYKFLLNLGLFHLFRAFFLNIIDFPHTSAPFHYFPGYYAFSTPFGRASDYYFSGHVGTALILSMFMLENGYSSLFKFGICVAFVQVVCMMIVRTHLFIDLYFGVVIAHFLKIVCDLLFEKCWLFEIFK